MLKCTCIEEKLIKLNKILTLVDIIAGKLKIILKRERDIIFFI